MPHVKPEEIKAGHDLTFYIAPWVQNYVWKRPSDGEYITGHVTSVEDGVIHISRTNSHWHNGAIQGRSWTNLTVTVEEAQKYVDEGLIEISASFPIRTWT